ncbi:MAG: MFS transporter [Gammaproteobacteria bacterium]|nr:MFS transporter [Gammaproteobacteria bacterium]
MSDSKQNPLARLVKSATMIEAHELKAVFVSFGFVFILMAAYYILRPLRDALASDWSNTEISMLWNLQFFVSLGLVALYGVLVSKIRFSLLVPTVYGFFALSFVGFYLGSAAVTDRVLLDKSFYVWVSMFSLFHVSVFWSFMADLYNTDQSRRLFSFIATGASAGASLGPLVPVLFAGHIGNEGLMLVASVMLLAPIPLVFYLQRLKITALHNDDVHADLSAARIGGNPIQGFALFLTNPYLLMIALFIFLYTAIGSFVYFEQTELLRGYSREERAAILGGLASVVNIVTFILGLFVTSRIVARFGMPVALAMVPFVICGGLLILAFAPILTVLLALQLVRQGANYGITRPAREMLYTHVDRETRFKAKPVIDVVVYRGGDALSGSAFAFLTDIAGFGIAAMAVIGAVIAAIWTAAGVYLGRVFDRKSAVK